MRHAAPPPHCISIAATGLSTLDCATAGPYESCGVELNIAWAAVTRPVGREMRDEILRSVDE